MTPTERIKSLLSALPKCDVPLGLKLFNTRQFIPLKELVDSDIIKQGRKPKGLESSSLILLQEAIYSYLYLLGDLGEDEGIPSEEEYNENYGLFENLEEKE
jgi:hypothetical protein